MKRLIGFACVLLIVPAAGRLAAQDPAQVQADDKAQIEAQIRAQETSQAPSKSSSDTHIESRIRLRLCGNSSRGRMKSTNLARVTKLR